MTPLEAQIKAKRVRLHELYKQQQTRDLNRREVSEIDRLSAEIAELQLNKHGVVG
jgi:hypothetical protein